MGKHLLKSFLGAVTFYTIIPLPAAWSLQFERIARWAPLIGILLGGLLSLLDAVLALLGMPKLTRSVLIIAIWIALTGGLHLDGAIDTADGLAVLDKQRRLEVMKDSVTGAFGVMAAVVLLLLKTAALSDLHSGRWLGLMASAGWGRWGQVVAIAFYPYLKPIGKGAFHKQAICLPTDLLLGLFCLISLSGFQIYLNPNQWWIGVAIAGFGCTVSTLVSCWLGHHLQGQTGDTYGAIVEWSEAFLLCLLTCLFK